MVSPGQVGWRHSQGPPRQQLLALCVCVWGATHSLWDPSYAPAPGTVVSTLMRPRRDLAEGSSNAMMTEVPKAS